MILRLCHYEGLSNCHGGSLGENIKALAPYIAPSETPEPFLPVLGPSPMMPLTPLTNGSIPVLSGMFFMLKMKYLSVHIINFTMDYFLAKYSCLLGRNDICKGNIPICVWWKGNIPICLRWNKRVF